MDFGPVDAGLDLFFDGSEPHLAALPVLHSWRPVFAGVHMHLGGVVEGRGPVLTSQVRWMDRKFRWCRTHNTRYCLDESETEVPFEGLPTDD
jgi:hypothetical protein